MTSVKNRILQFQQNTPDSSARSTNTAFVNSSATTTANSSVIKLANISVTNNHSHKSNNNNNLSYNNHHQAVISTNKQTHFPLPVPTRTSPVNGSANFNEINNSKAANKLQNYNHFGYSEQQNHHQHQVNGHHNNLRKSETNTFYDIAVDISLKDRKSVSKMNSPDIPPVNRANKPLLANKKASMTINLSSTEQTNGGTSPPKPKLVKSPSRTLSSNGSSSIPKLFSSNGSLNGGGTTPTTPNAFGVTMRNKSPGSNRSSPATTPTRGGGGVSNLGIGFNSSSSTNRLYGGIGWKEKYEDSEKKKNHLVNLAQKATRDYEELRRRLMRSESENEKLVYRLDGATNQLDSLRKASEAVYDDYYKLKKRYESENREKSEAFTRVDQYNKENRRLKRQSAALMMQINDPTSLASAFDAVCETDSAENDKEILYLRSRVQELESKIVDLDSELEKVKLAEFETQETQMLINDSVNSVKSENIQLKEQLKQLDQENRNVSTTLEDVTFEYDSLKVKYALNEEKLGVAEAELKKIQNEKNILQRQSLVFMNDAMDNRLMDALNQIGDLQTAMEDQRNRFETQLEELQNQLSERELQFESMDQSTTAKIRGLEDEVKFLRKRAQDAEQEMNSPESFAAPPPPPPLPGMSSAPPPPPFPPTINGNGFGGTSLNNSLKSAMGTLRKTGSNTPPNGLSGEGPKSIVTSSPQIDDMISQLKKGIKLKPTDRTLSRKPTELPQEKQEDTAVEEMRSILNNLRRTRRV